MFGEKAKLIKSLLSDVSYYRNQRDIEAQKHARTLEYSHKLEQHIKDLEGIGVPTKIDLYSPIFNNEQWSISWAFTPEELGMRSSDYIRLEYSQSMCAYQLIVSARKTRQDLIGVLRRLHFVFGSVIYKAQEES